MKSLFLAITLFFVIIINASVSIDIDISSQRLLLIEDGDLVRSFPISSSAFGEGQIENSLKTPYGKHIIKTKNGTYGWFSTCPFSELVKIDEELFDPDSILNDQGLDSLFTIKLQIHVRSLLLLRRWVETVYHRNGYKARKKELARQTNTYF